MAAPAAFGVLAVVSAYGAIALGGEIAHRRYRVAAELTRGIEHVLAGVLSAALPLVLTFHQIAGVAGVLTVAVATSRRLGIFRGIHDVWRPTWGEVCFPLGLLVAALVVPRAACFAFGALVMGVADGLAGLVGSRFGVRQIRVLGRPPKTALGSATFLVCTVAMGTGIMAAQGIAVPIAALGAGVAAAVLTPIEAACSRGVDDLVLPTAGSLAMLVLLILLC